MKYSIIVPVYNVENELPRCLESIINQSYQDIEIFLIDDGSTDNSADICNKYKSMDKRIIVIQEDNSGPSVARNNGLSKATGDYYIFVDSDDYLEKNFCEKIENALTSNPVDVLAVDMVCEASDKTVYMGLTFLCEGEALDGKEFFVRAVKSKELNSSASAYVYSGRFWKENRISFKEGVFHEDMDLTVNVLINAGSIMYVKGCCYHACARQGSRMRSNTNSEKRYRDMLDIIEYWKKLANDSDDNYFVRILHGYCARIFVYSASYNKIEKVDYSVISRRNLLKDSLCASDFLKICLLILFPKFLYYLRDTKHKGEN